MKRREKEKEKDRKEKRDKGFSRRLFLSLSFPPLFLFLSVISGFFFCLTHPLRLFLSLSFPLLIPFLSRCSSFLSPSLFFSFLFPPPLFLFLPRFFSLSARKGRIPSLVREKRCGEFYEFKHFLSRSVIIGRVGAFPAVHGAGGAAGRASRPASTQLRLTSKPSGPSWTFGAPGRACWPS